MFSGKDTGIATMVLQQLQFLVLDLERSGTIKSYSWIWKRLKGPYSFLLSYWLLIDFEGGTFIVFSCVPTSVSSLGFNVQFRTLQSCRQPWLGISGSWNKVKNMKVGKGTHKEEAVLTGEGRRSDSGVRAITHYVQVGNFQNHLFSKNAYQKLEDLKTKVLLNGTG